MEKLFSLRLEKLFCFKEDDGTGHSEPYIWPILLVINDTTLATSTPVKRIFKSAAYAQVVLKKDMQQNESADIPQEIGLFKTRYSDQLKTDYFILIVLLWEKDETPKKAVLAGYSAFGKSVPSAIADNLPALAASGNLDELKNAIIDKVKAEIRSAIKNSLSNLEKLNVASGILNLDDIVGPDFKVFKNVQVTSGLHIFLGCKSEDEKNLYMITGTVEVTSV
jgi:hypothetical protein